MIGSKSESLSRRESDDVQKYGRPNEETPAKWNAEYKDFNAPLQNGTAAAPEVKAEIPPAPTITADAEAATAGAQVGVEAPPEPAANDTESKKRKRHEGETPEERAERKRKKKEKKEKRKTKKGELDESD